MPEYETHLAAMGEPLKDVVGHFESLGWNCEFGFIQHGNSFGEGTLFAWALTETVEGLVKLLNARFENLYSLDRLTPGQNGMAYNADYGIAFHSQIFGTHSGGNFIPSAAAERPQRHAEEFEKIQYLVDKVLKSLAKPGRIWVYKNTNGVSLPQAVALHGALKRYAPHRLLIVLEAKGRHRPGTVDVLDEKLLIGHITRYSPGDRAFDYDPTGWRQILDRTLALTGSPRR
jgi:hypothetical protein